MTTHASDPSEPSSKKGFLARFFTPSSSPKEALVTESSALSSEEDLPSPESSFPKDPPPKNSWWKRLKQGLARSSSALSEKMSALLTHRKLDETLLEELEEVLLRSDLGLAATEKICTQLRHQRYAKNIDLKAAQDIMAQEIEKILTPVARPLTLDPLHKPFVILVVGVNGSGKTTTIGKLAASYRAAGHSILLAAGDTFRAAGQEQLQIWGQRTGVDVLRGAEGSDAASLAFDAFHRARQTATDLLLIDTAGRLQNRTELMDELEKIVRVLRKIDITAPHAVLLVLDATIGQNALRQVEIFGQKTGVTGLIMTKLDGTARGGILVAIASQFGLPIHFIGVGEEVEDLASFNAHDFTRALLDLRD